MYSMARYIERAESIARLLDVGRRMSSLLPDPEEALSEWTSTIEAAGCEGTFAEAYGVATASHVIDHLVRDPRNPSSIFACLAIVRQNARAVRTALSQDVWDAVNGMWIKSHRAGPTRTSRSRGCLAYSIGRRALAAVRQRRGEHHAPT
jgi:uncharacterized alpha-E superfamily protein